MDKAAPTTSSSDRFWLPIVAFVATTFAFGLVLLGLQRTAGIDLRLVAVVQAAPALGLLTTWLFLPEKVQALLPGPPEDAARYSRRLAILLGVVVAYAGATFLLASASEALPSELPYTGVMLALLTVLIMWHRRQRATTSAVTERKEM